MFLKIYMLVPTFQIAQNLNKKHNIKEISLYIKIVNGLFSAKFLGNNPTVNSQSKTILHGREPGYCETFIAVRRCQKSHFF